MKLADLTSAHDVARLSLDDIKALADEMRETIVETVSINGGHLAPSLGTVELTLALHAVFESPKDKIVWDVGHQAYGHKLLTGRYEQFCTLRKRGGIAGYLSRGESSHDQFGAGHASTAISAALGMAKARDIQGGRHAVVAIFGDGALTGGLAYEGLNNAGHLGTDLIVVLNDNSMSISPNVGSVSGYLMRLRTEQSYTRLKHEVKYAVQRIPRFGSQMLKTASRVKEGIVHVLTPGALFEELGFTYLGPVDGHDFVQMRDILRRARDLGGPVFIHAITAKGKGYKVAEEDPNKWHASSPFDPETGKSRSTGKKPVSWSQAFGETMVDLAKEDPRLVAITAAMSDGTGLNGFRQAFPNRFFDVGIAEAHATTFSGGLATQGMRPVAAIYSTFLQRAYDQIIHDICIQNLPVIFALDRAGLVGDDGATHQGVFDMAYMRLIPNMTIAIPRDIPSLKAILAAALQHDGPVALRYARGAAVEDLGPVHFAWGTGEVMRQGRDGLVLAIGSMVETSLLAAEQLAAQGVHLEVVDVRFLKPLDRKLLSAALERHTHVFTVEEGTLHGGLGDAVLELSNEVGYEGQLTRLGIPDMFIEHGTRTEQLDQVGLSVPKVAERIGKALLWGVHAS